MKHALFISRTVFVKNQDIDKAVRTLNRILGREGVIDDVRRLERYEKPWQTRRRINYELSKSIYNEDMTRKINFLMRKSRPEPYPGCY
ncbi:hypothetical protein RUM43_001534 [Polyplax serrata]|uniref:Ribosomal protein S21 n=1 Tax=Polyplax serrata TaxID=468196 RepID=A0AAN8SE18_POLSC